MPLDGTCASSQTVDAVRLEVPLKGVSPATVDILATPRYVKVNYAPYILHVDLHGDIDESTGLARVDQGTLHLTLGKSALGLWPSVLHTCGGEDVEKKEAKRILKVRRERSVSEYESRQKELKEAKEKRKQADKKASTKHQMALDEAERNELDDLKAREKESAEKEVYEKFAALAAASVKEKEKSVSSSASTVSPHKKASAIREANPADAAEISSPKDDDAIFTPQDASRDESDALHRLGEEVVVEEEEEEIKYIPAPRCASRVVLSFTPRAFPTPMRESTKEEEEDWLLRNGRHLTSKSRIKLEGSDISERDPFWLKGKGDDFFRKGDILAAINAYSTALEGDPGMLASLSNRAACYLKLEKFNECRDDCTRALQVLHEDETARNEAAAKAGTAAPKELKRDRELRKKVLVRRGTAHCAEGNYVDGLKDYQLAQELVPNDPRIKADCARIAILVQCDALRETGNESFKSRDYVSAASHYSKAIRLDPGQVACYSNRAACRMAQKDYSAAASDISQALRIAAQQPGAPPLSGRVPSKGTPEFRQWHKNLYVKRGLAMVKAGNLDQAAQDYKDAVDLDPLNKDLVTDWRKIVHQRNSRKKSQNDAAAAAPCLTGSDHH